MLQPGTIFFHAVPRNFDSSPVVSEMFCSFKRRDFGSGEEYAMGIVVGSVCREVLVFGSVCRGVFDCVFQTGCLFVEKQSAANPNGGVCGRSEGWSGSVSGEHTRSSRPYRLRLVRG